MPRQELYNNLFHLQPEDNDAKESLQLIVYDYPYFSLAHFFLLKQTPASAVNYKKIAARTALHFNNPFLLNYQLNRKMKMVSQFKFPGISNTKEVTAVQEVSDVPVVSALETLPVANPEAVTTKKDELLFEPLHTTDYFASQGIKLSEEVQAGDKLGKQLKSFTDWLKTMKKVNQGKLPETNPHIDLAVQNLAEKSNKEQEVITESMAEVYIQQGKTGKAREIYKKLSLLNPAKSAYFAAKLEILKEN